MHLLASHAATVFLSRRCQLAMLAAAVIASLCTLIRIAWFADDPFITYRVVDNFIHGYGLRWNIIERVQVYTHPLWMLVHIPAMFWLPYPMMAGFAVSLMCILATGWLIYRSMPVEPLRYVLGWLALVIFSTSLREFSWSGLENPLSHALCAWLIHLLHQNNIKRAWLWVPLAVSLLVLNRMDLALLVLPLCFWFAWHYRPIRWHWLILAALPFVAWHAFAFIYYGFFLPSTAHAKLYHDVPSARITLQGIYYLRDFIAHDPLGALTIISATLCSLAATITQRGSHKRYVYISLMLGVWLYIAYTIRSGGDFMSMRFFSVPVFMSACILYVSCLQWIRWRYLMMLAMVIFGIQYFDKHIRRSILTYHISDIPSKNISQERHQYRGNVIFRRGLLTPDWHPKKQVARRGYQLFVSSPQISTQGHWAGARGYFRGPNYHIIDHYAITSPLISRIPHVTHWKLIGHMQRDIPRGYRHFIRSGSTARMMPNMAQYTEKLHLVVSGNLWSAERWRTILGFQRGDYQHLMHKKGEAGLTSPSFPHKSHIAGR